jgi:hypothetical protein
MQAMSAELESKQAKEQADMQLAQMKLEIERFKAETDRMKAEADMAVKMAAPELSEAEKVQFDAELQIRLEEMRQDHDVEMAMLQAKLKEAEAALEVEPVDMPAEPVRIERDESGAPITVNGRAVVRDEMGNIIGLQ